MNKGSINKDRKVLRNSTMDLNTMVYGKVPPQAKDLEESVLGAIMIERGAIDVASEILKPESFYMESHQRIFRAMQELSRKSMPIDINLVVEQLKSTEDLEMCGGPYYITKLTNNIVSSANIEFHARVIHQKFLQREMIRICGEAIHLAYEDMSDPYVLFEQFDRQYSDLTINSSHKAIPLSAGLVEQMQEVSRLMQRQDHVTGITSGFHMIDAVTHGWQDTDLIILAARPGVGKTALALNFARNAAMNKRNRTRVGFFSLEMSYGQLVKRLMSAESELWLERIITGKMQEEHRRQLFEMGAKPLSEAEIFIDDTPSLTIFELRAKARRLKRKHDVGLIIIDYLQLMSGDTSDSRNREREIAQISRGLKGLAKELSVPIIALSQLSRDPERRKGESKIPRLSDLRESGAIEQDADMVMFIYRPEYYDNTGNEMGEINTGETIISIAKHRNGKLATGSDVIKLRADLAIQKFYDWDSMLDLKSELGPGKWTPVKEDREDQLP